MKIPEPLKRAGSIFLIATHLGTTAPVKADNVPSLEKQYAKFSHVSLEETRRAIKRTTTKTYVPGVTLDRRTARQLRK